MASHWSANDDPGARNGHAEDHVGAGLLVDLADATGLTDAFGQALAGPRALPSRPG